MNTLYIVPTPIGNLEDMTLRAIRILKEVNLIAAEDTRNSYKLLQHYDISTPMISYHEHNKLSQLEVVFDVLQTGDVALISDAGTPGISDPGYELIQQAIKTGTAIIPLPGASAVITGLVASGFPTNAFTFLGFPPRKYEALRTFLKGIQDRRETLIFYESPNRLLETMNAMLEVWGDREGVVARELTKLYEEFQRLPLSELITYYLENPPRGEITLLIHGNELTEDTWNEDRVRQALIVMLSEGKKRSAAAKIIAQESGWDRRDVYNLEL